VNSEEPTLISRSDTLLPFTNFSRRTVEGKSFDDSFGWFVQQETHKQTNTKQIKDFIPAL
jgi:hypothetical protein